MRLLKDERDSKNAFVVLDQLDQGWSTKSFPHLISDRQLYVADNVVFNRDGLVSKRPGSQAYGHLAGQNGKTGSGVASQSGARFYPVTGSPYLMVQSGGALYKAQDNTGTFSAIAGAALSATNAARYQQVFDPDLSTGAATGMIVVDGVHTPQVWDGVNWTAVRTGAGWLPNGATGFPITPGLVAQWKYHTVYAGEPTDPTAVYISDALRPEAFTGFSMTDSAGTNYTAYYPAGRNTGSGVITGIAVVNAFLVVFYSNMIVIGYNTGTYGAYEFEWITLSAKLGCVAPSSIVSFDTYVVFFAGDAFFATDGENIVKLPDLIPSVYATTAQSAFPCEMYNKNLVVGARHGDQYWASYDNIGDGVLHAIVVFDRSANGGWSFGAASGGAWSRFPTGMPLSWAVECRGPGDSSFPIYWGSSVGDQIAQYDTGVYSDLGADIAMEIRCKAFLLENPVSIKDVQAIWVLATFPQLASQANFTVTAYPFVVTDLSNPNTSSAPSITFNINNQEVLYGDGTLYGQGALYGFAGTILTDVQCGQPPQDAKGYIFQPGIREKSSFPFNIIALVPEVIIDDPLVYS